MGKAIWVVFVMGILALVLVMVGFLATLTLFSESPAGNRARLAENIRGRFNFDSAGVQVKLDEGKKVLRVSYETSQDSGNDVLRQQKEMKEVAEHAARQYDEKDKKEIEEIRVVRTEVHGRGCWQDRRVARESFPNPARNAVEPFRFDK